MSSVRLAILETSPIGLDALEEFYRTLFIELGYETEIIRIAGSDQPSFSGAGIFENNNIDIFVSDLSLGKQDSYDGLTVIKKIKREFPNLLVIANSMTNVTFVEAASHVPSFDLFICKSKIHDKIYKKYILNKLRILFKRNVYLDEFDMNITKSKLFRSNKHKQQLDDILRTVTFTSNNMDQLTAVNKIKLSPIYGGYSGSEVYRLSAYTKSDLKCINAVLKISTIEDAREEKDNYLKYVKWYLPYTWRPELIGFAETKDYGALCYSFVYNDEVPFMSLTEYLNVGNTSKLSVAIDSIFDPHHQRWYHENNIQEGTDLTEYYYNKWFYKRETNEQEFCSIIRRFGEVYDNFVIVNKERYNKPNGYLLGLSRKKHSTCICHGDLNTNNILISENSGMSFIDFQNTKRGHVFEDFVVFEACIRIYVNFEEVIISLIDDEWHLNKSSEEKTCDYTSSNNTSIKKTVYPQILKLRNYARLNAPNESFMNYYYALALYCFRLLRIPTLKTWQKEQVIACLLSSERMLLSLESSSI